jgi:ubiquinone/menaquinone biosynthesis C-methylase UbiE
LAHGEVLEIGFGTGTNLSYYDPERVTRLYALEPNGRMIQMSERHPVRAAFDIRYLDVPGERLPLGDGSVDSVVSTFTLCTISGVTDAVREIARVLRADGRLIFLENTASPDPPVRLWQRLWAPIHYRVFAGLDLTRNVPSYLEAGGFSFEHIEIGYLAPFPKSWACCCWGTAICRS